MSTTMNQLLERRKAAADKYDEGWPLRTTMDNLSREGFLAGWDAAIHQIELLVQTPGGDGCFCTHHPDDPAHTKDCYDLMKALIGK